MAEADLEIVRDQFEAVNQRDFERGVGRYAEDIRLVVTGGLEAGTYEGREAVRTWFDRFLKQFRAEYRIEVEELTDLGGAVLAVVTHHGIGRNSGVEVSSTIPHLFGVRDRKVARIEVHNSREAAVAAGSEGSRHELE